MRIIFAHNDYGRPSGEEHAIESTARLLQGHGHDVIWFRKSSAAILDSRFEQAKAFFSGIHSWRAGRELGDLLDAERVDVLHVQNLYPLLSPSILSQAKRRRVPIVMRCPNYRLFCPSGLHLHESQVCERCLGGKEWSCVLQNCEGSYVKSLGYALRTAAARLSRSILDNVTRFVVLSEFQRERYVASGVPGGKIDVLHNFVESPPRIDKAAPVGDTVAFLGRLGREKGIELFLRAAAALPEYSFAIAGDPASYPGVERIAPPNVRFRGFLRGEELDRFCREMRMVVVPSVCFEGFPNTITRAMSYGKPVICSRIGPLPEIVVEGQTGLLHEPNALDELIARIRHLQESPELCRRLGVQGRRRALSEYNRDRFYDKLMSIYRSAVVEVASKGSGWSRSPIAPSRAA